jgi:hypothetical protein
MRRKIDYLLLPLICLISLNAMAQGNLNMMKMESEMLRLISSPDKDAFMQVTEKLKAECQKQGNERLFYSAWGNQSTYEATHQNYMLAEEIADQIAAIFKEKKGTSFRGDALLFTRMILTFYFTASLGYIPCSWLFPVPSGMP